MFVQFKVNGLRPVPKAFLKALHKACPIKINKLLTDNGKGFTDRLFVTQQRQSSGKHELNRLRHAA